MEKKESTALYTAIGVLFLAVIVIISMNLYSRGKEATLSADLPIIGEVNLHLSKVTVRPISSSETYLVFSAELKNNSNQTVRTYCDTYSLSYSDTVCAETYSTYQSKADIYKLNLVTPDNSACSFERSSSSSGGANDLNNLLEAGSFQPKDDHTGRLIFKCPQSSGVFKMSYATNSLNIELK